VAAVGVIPGDRALGLHVGRQLLEPEAVLLGVPVEGVLMGRSSRLVVGRHAVLTPAQQAPRRSCEPLRSLALGEAKSVVRKGYLRAPETQSLI
jgi:hypothetical protein